MLLDGFVVGVESGPEEDGVECGAGKGSVDKSSFARHRHSAFAGVAPSGSYDEVGFLEISAAYA